MGHQTHEEKPISWKRKIKIFLITHINYDNFQYINSFSSAPLSFWKWMKLTPSEMKAPSEMMYTTAYCMFSQGNV